MYCYILDLDLVGSVLLIFLGLFFVLSYYVYVFLLYALSSVLRCPLRFPHENDVRSKTCHTLKHFDNAISTCCENVVDVFESLTTSF